LAAFVDRDERVREWLELSVQTMRDLADSPALVCGLLTNDLLDSEWQKWVAAARALNPQAFITTSWDRQPPTPWVVDLKKRAIVRLVHALSQQPFILCRDNASLTSAGRTAYGSSLERWFQTTETSGETKWISQEDLSAEKNEAGSSTLLAATEGELGHAYVDFNLSGGQMVLRRYDPIGLESWIDWLRTGTTPPSASAQTTTTETPEGFAEPVHAIEHSILSSSPLRRGSADRFFRDEPALERLHLRVDLWASIVREVHRACTLTTRPFFNLAPDSFRIDAGSASLRVPAGWASRPSVVKPGEAMPIVIAELGTLFVPCGPAWDTSSVERFGGWQLGKGTVRFSQISEAKEGAMRLEGFIDGSGLRDATESTIVWVQLPLDNKTLSFVATLEPEQGAVGRAGIRFKASNALVPSQMIARLKNAASPRRSCQYCVLTPVSPTLDLHALGMIGLRILLAPDASSVTELEDDIFELASLLPKTPEISHLDYVATLPETNPRLLRLLSASDWNPHPKESANSYAPIPKELWYAVVRELVEFVAVEEHPPATAAHEALENLDSSAWLTPFSARLLSLENLSIHIRGLLTAPRPAQEEIARVIHQFIGQKK
jgi:hypothetical protein